ncbi:MAG TPA: glycoside hydrolase family protein [Polyangiaceae bacterium]|nr:glycoside hydrolase family protein [Polyangiaceae bacterium]
MPRTGRFALLAACLVATVAPTGACGSNDLEPIQAPAVADASAADREPPADAGVAPADAASPPEDSADEAAAADASSLPCKRGVAANAAPTAALAPSLTLPGVTWWYNWAAQAPDAGAPSVEYVPMLWGGGSLNQAIPAGSKYLLGFNEPNFKSQANLTVQQAAADWPMVEARSGGIPIGSPGVNYCGSASDSSQCTESAITDPFTYLKDFFAACGGCRVDFVAVHAYVCDVTSLRGYIEGNTDAGGTTPGFLQFGRPIWVTELACDGSKSVAEQKAFMQAAVPYLESNPNVARYAWFSAKPIPNALLVNPDGSLTDLGSTYVSLPASCH